MIQFITALNLFKKKPKFESKKYILPGELDIINYPNPILKKVSPELDHNSDLEFNILVADRLKELMLQHDGQARGKWLGVGLAAPQIGVSRRIFVMTPNKKYRERDVWYCFNPRIVAHGKQIKFDQEGCLSVPNKLIQVPRWCVIDIEYINEKGSVVKETLKNWPARIFQHELDHLNGRLCIDNKKEAIRNEDSNGRYSI